MSHRTKANVSHSEAALGAGRAYEKINEGHNQMFDSVKDLEVSHRSAHAVSHNESRGKRIDQELEKEDRETIERMNESHNQKEANRRPSRDL